MLDLTMTIINHGEPAYSQRLAIARMRDPLRRFQRWTSLVWFEALAYVRRFGSEPFTVAELCQITTELDLYYAEHIAEIDRCIAEDGTQRNAMDVVVREDKDVLRELSKR